MTLASPHIAAVWYIPHRRMTTLQNCFRRLYPQTHVGQRTLHIPWIPNFRVNFSPQWAKIVSHIADLSYHIKKSGSWRLSCFQSRYRQNRSKRVVARAPLKFFSLSIYAWPTFDVLRCRVRPSHCGIPANQDFWDLVLGPLSFGADTSSFECTIGRSLGCQICRAAYML